MKKVILSILALLTLAQANAQDETTSLTMFKTFQPATIHLSTGKHIKHPLANIALADAALLYLQNSYTMQANMETVAGVDIDTLHFVNIKNQLALCQDTVGENQLFCITLIDMDSYRQNLKNNTNITNLDMSAGQTSYSTIDLEGEGEHMLPLIRNYYYRYNGELVRVHEREISRRLPKDKRHIYKSIISLPTFTWTDKNSLVQLLKAITEKSE